MKGHRLVSALGFLVAATLAGTSQAGRGQGAGPTLSPVAVARSFFEAANRADEAGLLACLAPGAVVKILSMEFRGHEAILAFMRRDVWGGAYSGVALHPVKDGVEAWVDFTPKGWRTSEPPIAYRMWVREGKIERLEGRYRATGEKPSLLEDELPAGFKSYLLGVRNRDADTAMRGFSKNPVVIDVGRRIPGQAAIRDWFVREVIGLVYVVEAITTTPTGLVLRLGITLGGGGGFKADYFLTLDPEGRIVTADLRYAE